MSNYPCPKCGKPLIKNGKTPGGKVRWSCMSREAGKCVRCYTTTRPEAPPRKRDGRTEAKAKTRAALPISKRYVITWAQNATPVHTGFFNALRAYCEANRAELIVIPGRYKNPTSRWSASQANEEMWAPEVVPYLYDKRKKLNDNLRLIADIKIQPTAARPLTGFESITHTESGIIGHPKLQLRAIPTPQNRMPKLLTTTGAVTVRNYTDSRAGKTGEFHHVFGAVVVEVESSRIFHLRHLNYSEQHLGFIDLDTAYFSNGDVLPAPDAEAIVFGDAHWRFAAPEVVAATFTQLVPRVNPRFLVWHDLLDAYAVNPHHKGNPFIAYAKRKSGFDDIRREVENTIDWMLDLGRGRHNVIVPSNHDDMLKRWIINTDWRTDPVNAEFYLETALKMLRSTRMSETGTLTLDPFQHLVTERLRDHDIVTCVPINGSFVIAGIECALHGNEGPNGARGSLQSLRKIGPKIIIGHSHTPGIEDGAYQVGTMTRLKAEYTGPVGSWLNTHCMIDAFGKRHLLTCINGKFWMEDGK